MDDYPVAATVIEVAEVSGESRALHDPIRPDQLGELRLFANATNESIFFTYDTYPLPWIEVMLKVLRRSLATERMAKTMTRACLIDLVN